MPLILASLPAAPQGDPADSESAAELAALLAPADAELAAAFASSELAPRVAALCTLHAWVRAAQAQRGPAAAHAQEPAAAEAAAAAAAAARDAGVQLWRRLLALATTDRELGAQRYSAMGPLHRKKVGARLAASRARLGWDGSLGHAALRAPGRPLARPANLAVHLLHPPPACAGAAVAGAVRAEPAGAGRRGGAG